MGHYDVVYFWLGGRERGEWKAASPNAQDSVGDMVNTLNLMGYVAHRGFLSVGPPEGPPEDAEFRKVEL